MTCPRVGEEVAGLGLEPGSPGSRLFLHAIWWGLVSLGSHSAGLGPPIQGLRPSSFQETPTHCPPVALTSTRENSLKLVLVIRRAFSLGMPPRMSTGDWSTLYHRGLDGTFAKYLGFIPKSCRGKDRRATQHCSPTALPHSGKSQSSCSEHMAPTVCPTTFPLPPSLPDPSASSVLLEYTRHIATSGPLHRLFPLYEMTLPQCPCDPPPRLL